MNLAGSPPGQNYTAIATASAANPVAGTVYRLEWGNGTGTALWLGNGIVGIGNSAVNQTQLSTEATQLRAVVFPDEAGRVCVATNRSAILAADFPTSSATPVDVTNMAIALPVGTWAIFLTATHRTTNGSVGFIPSLRIDNGARLGGTFAEDPHGAPAANLDYSYTAMALVTITSTLGTVTLQAAAETTGATVTLRAQSAMVAMRIA